MDRLPAALEKYVEEAARQQYEIWRDEVSRYATPQEFTVARRQWLERAEKFILFFLNAAEKDGWAMARSHHGLGE